MKKIIAILLILTLLIPFAEIALSAAEPTVKLGDDLLMAKYHHLLEGKRIGLITNQTGVNSQRQSMVDVIAADKTLRLTALFAPEHGLDGTAPAGDYVESTIHPTLGIPVYSLYGPNRGPSQAMLENIDVLLFDLQDIGARTYTYMSTLNYCLESAQEYGKTILVLDRPNPIGGEIVEGPILEDAYKSFVGVDNLPMAHGMTAGELAQYFNRKIGADLKVIPMEGYARWMVWQDTGLTWVPTSPNVPDVMSAFGYMATGLAEGTGIYMSDKFKWVGGAGIDAQKFADLLNKAGLPGVSFVPEYIGGVGGVRLNILNYNLFNPAKTGIYALAYAHQLTEFRVPKSTSSNIVMFDKVMGTNKIGLYLEQNLSPWQTVSNYTPGLNRFKLERVKYLIYGENPYQDEIIVVVGGTQISFDSPPYIDASSRLMVPLRAIGEALGARVDWNADTQTITITRQGKVIQLRINSTRAVVDGEQRNMDTTPAIKNNRTMVPVRFVSEFLGIEVNWNQDTRSVVIN